MVDPGWPGDVLAVELVVLQAVVQLSEQLVRQPAQRGLVRFSGGAAASVVGVGAFGFADGVEGPPSAGVGKSLVAGSAHQDDSGFARGSGDRCGSGVTAPGGRVGEAVRVVPELAEHPRAEDHAESGQELNYASCLAKSYRTLSLKTIDRSVDRGGLDVALSRLKTTGRSEASYRRGPTADPNATPTCTDNAAQTLTATRDESARTLVSVDFPSPLNQRVADFERRIAAAVNHATTAVRTVRI